MGGGFCEQRCFGLNGNVRVLFDGPSACKIGFM